MRAHHHLWKSLGETHIRGFIHKLFQPFVEGATHPILATRHGAELRGQHNAIEVHPIQAKHFQRPLQITLEQQVVADRTPGLANQRGGRVDVGVVGELDGEEGIRKLTRLVGHGFDLTEGHRVHEPFAVAQAQGADGQAFHRAGVARVEHHPITDGNSVLNDDEQPGDHVLHQLLRTETDGQANHPGTGQQRRHVDP